MSTRKLIASIVRRVHAERPAKLTLLKWRAEDRTEPRTQWDGKGQAERRAKSRKEAA